MDSRARRARPNGRRHKVHNLLSCAQPPTTPEGQLRGQQLQEPAHLARGELEEATDELHRPAVRALVGLVDQHPRADAVAQRHGSRGEGAVFGRERHAGVDCEQGERM